MPDRSDINSTQKISYLLLHCGIYGSEIVVYPLSENTPILSMSVLAAISNNHHDNAPVVVLLNFGTYMGTMTD